MNPGAERLTIVLQRQSAQQPWGFRLQGGTDFTTPLSVQSVAPGGVAQQCGLAAGDAVLQINNRSSDELEHEAAKQEIVQSGNSVQLIVERGAVSVWKPKVTPLSDLKPEERQYLQSQPGYEGMTQKTSLAANKPEVHHIGSAHNRSARPFPGFGGGASPAAAPQPQQPPPQMAAPVPQHPPQMAAPAQQPREMAAPETPPQAQPSERVPAVVHAQYNSPMGMYSADNLVDTYSVQSKALMADMERSRGEGTAPVGIGGASTGAPRVAGTRSVQAPTTKPASEYQQPQQHMTCKACGMLCVGVFVRVKGEAMHPECYKCARCSMSLKNQGFFTVEGKLYCEKCAKFVATPPEPNMVAMPVYR